MKKIIVILALAFVGFVSTVNAEGGVPVVVRGELFWIEQGPVLYIDCLYNPESTCFIAIVTQITFPDGSTGNVYDVEIDGHHYCVTSYSTADNQRYALTLCP